MEKVDAAYIIALANAAESLIAAARQAGGACHECGYSAWRTSVETGEKTCEVCDMRGRARDGERMEREWKAKAEEAETQAAFNCRQFEAMEAERDKERAARVEAEKKVEEIESFMEKIRQECRGKNPDGATLLDFMAVWNEQYKAAVERERQRADAAVALVRRLYAFARDIAVNYDHEEDYHRHGNADICCRTCKAEKVMAEAEAWLKQQEKGASG